MILANPLTSAIGAPSDPAKGQTCVAVEMSEPAGSASRSSVRKSRKLAESFGETALPPLPVVPGYSQSISIPSRSYRSTAAMMFATNVLRLADDAQIVEKYFEPVHPPILSLTRLPAAWPVATSRLSRLELSSWLNSRPKDEVGRAKAKSRTSYLDQSTLSGVR